MGRLAEKNRAHGLKLRRRNLPPPSAQFHIIRAKKFLLPATLLYTRVAAADVAAAGAGSNGNVKRKLQATV